MQDYEKVKFWTFPSKILRFQTRKSILGNSNFDQKFKKMQRFLKKNRWKGMKCIVYKFLLVRRLCNNYIWLADKWLQPFYIFHFFWSLFIFRGWSIFIRFVWIVRFSATTVRSTSQTRITFTKDCFQEYSNLGQRENPSWIGWEYFTCEYFLRKRQSCHPIHALAFYFYTFWASQRLIYHLKNNIR